MLSRLAMLHRLSDCFFFTLRCQPALVRVLVTLCASAMMEFMPCATRPCLWRDFELPLRPGCHHPSYHSDFLVKTHLPPLVSFVSLFFSLSPSVSAFAVLIRPSSFFGPSPCLLAAGAYCRTFSPVRLVFLRKERDSNPRNVTACHFSDVPLTTQPSFRKQPILTNRLHAITIKLFNNLW